MSGRRFVVALHESFRLLGGWEEGGWWYDAGVPADTPAIRRYTKVFRSRTKALRYAERLEAVAKKLSVGARSLSSIAYDGGQYLPVVQKGEQPRRWPTHRPNYE